MNRTRTLLAALALALPVPVAIAGCGGDEGSNEDPNDVLTATFENENQLESGVIDLNLSFAAEGDQGGSIDASVTGPFQMDPDDPDAPGQLDLDIDVSADGAAAEGFPGFEGSVTVTDDNLFVNYEGTDYELGTEQYQMLVDQAEEQSGSEEGDSEDGGSATSFKEGCEQAIEQAGGETGVCDIDITAWFSDLSNEGSEDKGGAEATHIAGQLNVEQMVRDLVGIASGVPGAAEGGVDPATIEPFLGIISEAVSEASFDIYSATEDDTLRGLDFSLGIDPASIPGGESAGVSDVTLDFGFEISDVGSEQEFEAPEDPQPIEDLQEELGGIAGVPGVDTSIPGGEGLPEATSPGATPEIDPACLQEAVTPDEIQECLGE